MSTVHPTLDPATLARYAALRPDERARVARVVSLTGCSLPLAIAAVEATRRQLAVETKENRI